MMVEAAFTGDLLGSFGPFIRAVVLKVKGTNNFARGAHRGECFCFIDLRERIDMSFFGMHLLRRRGR